MMRLPWGDAMTDVGKSEETGIGAEQYRTIFEKAPDGLLVIDGGSGMILLANEAAQGMFGLDAEPLPRIHVSAILPARTKSSVEEILDKVKVFGSCFVQSFQGVEGDRMMDLTATLLPWTGEHKAILASFRDATERETLAGEKEILIAELKQAVARVKHLSGLLPICANCKKIRDDSGYWHQVEAYLQEHADATLTHGICPQCVEKFYPGMGGGTPGEDQPDGEGEESTS